MFQAIEVRGSPRTFFFPQSRPNGKGCLIRPVLSSPHPGTLWTEYLSAVVTGACAGRANSRRTTTWLRFLCNPLALFPWSGNCCLNAFICFVWSPLWSPVPRYRHWRLRLPPVKMRIAVRAMSHSLAPRTAPPNFPKPVTTLRSTERRRRENRFASPPRPIWLRLSNTPSAATRCFCPRELLSTYTICPRKNAPTSITSRCAPTRPTPSFPPRARASLPPGLVSPAFPGVPLLPNPQVDRRSYSPPSLRGVLREWPSEITYALLAL